MSHELTVPTTRLTPEEREARYAQLRLRQERSPIYARHTNPNLYVRWVRDDKHDVSLHKHLGFEFAKDNPKVSAEKRSIDTSVPISEDGMYRTGDVILMVIFRDDYEFYCSENAKLSRLTIDNGKKAFRSEAAKLRVPTFERDENGNRI